MAAMTSGVASPEEQYSPLDEDALQDLYTWIDEIPLSRPKRSISRDFSDGGEFIDSLYNANTHFISSCCLVVAICKQMYIN